MKPWILIPAKPFRDAKTRLLPVLSSEMCALLAEAMLARTIKVARAASPNSVITIVSYSGMADTIASQLGADRLFLSKQSGLNEQLMDAALLLPDADQLLVLHADLPLLKSKDVTAMLEAEQEVAMAPDRGDSGTNALMFRGDRRFFDSGADSFARHISVAQGHRITVEKVRRLGLSFDLDVSKDWRDLQSLELAEAFNQGSERGGSATGISDNPLWINLDSLARGFSRNKCACEPF